MGSFLPRRGKTLHSSLLNFPRFPLVRFSRLSNVFWIAVYWICWTEQSFQCFITANFLRMPSTSSSSLLTKILKINDPYTPLVTGLQLDFVALITILWDSYLDSFQSVGVFWFILSKFMLSELSSPLCVQESFLKELAPWFCQTLSHDWWVSSSPDGLLILLESGCNTFSIHTGLPQSSWLFKNGRECPHKDIIHLSQHL